MREISLHGKIRKWFAQPRNVKFKQIQNGTGASFELVWSPRFSKKMNSKMQATQVVVDSEFLRYLLPRLPKDTGELEHKTIIANASLVGTGLVTVPGPSAQMLNRGYVMVGINSGKAYANPGEKKRVTDKPLVFKGAPMRGANFVERTWADEGPNVVKAAKKAFRNGGNG